MKRRTLLRLGPRALRLTPMAPICPACASAAGRRHDSCRIMRCAACGHQWAGTPRERGDAAIDCERRRRLAARWRDPSGRFLPRSTVLMNLGAA